MLTEVDGNSERRRSCATAHKMRVPVHAPCGILPRLLPRAPAETEPALYTSAVARKTVGVGLLSYREYLCETLDGARRCCRFAGAPGDN